MRVLPVTRTFVAVRVKVSAMASSAAPGAPPAAAKPALAQGALFALPAGAALPETVDIGCNLADDAFERDRDDVLERAHAAGVRRVIITGTSVRQSRRVSCLPSRLQY